MSDSVASVMSGYPLTDHAGAEHSETARKLLNLFGQLKTRRENWDSVWEEITQYMLPRHSLFDWDSGERGARRRKPVYDSTGIRALDTVGDGICGYSIPQNGNWFEFSLADQSALELPGARAFLQESTEQLKVELDRSTFYQAMRQAVPIDVGLGTAHLYTEEDIVDGSTYIESLHNKEIWIHADRKGRVNTWVRKIYLPLDQLISEYPSTNKDIVRRAKTHPFEEEAVIIFVMPRPVRDVTGLTGKDKPWAAYHVLESTSELLYEGGYDEPPFITHRWTYMSDEVYGRGWGHDVLTDVLRLNQIMKAMIRAAQLAVDPPVQHPSNLRFDLDLNPGGRVMSNQPIPVQKIDLLGAFPITERMMQELRAAVRDAMMYDFFISLQQQRGSRTATEVLEMQGEKAAVLGTITSSLYNDLYTPAMARVYMNAIKQGRMPAVPDSLAEQGGLASLKVEFKGPLAQIAKRFHSQQSIQQTMASFLPLTEVFPEMRHLVDPLGLGKYILNEGGFPQRAMRDEGQIKQILAAEAQQAQQMQQMAAMESAGKALPGLAKAQEVVGEDVLPTSGGAAPMDRIPS